MEDVTQELKSLDQLQIHDDDFGGGDKKICPVCQKSEKDMKFCGACKSIFYCSPKCQKQDWKQHKEFCCPFKICDDPILGGKGWKATRDIKSGTVLLDELPAVSTPDWGETYFQEEDFTPSCIVCGLFMEKDKSRRCSLCKWPICSVDCESLDCHTKNECQVFQKADLTFPPPSSIFGTPSLAGAFIAMIRGFNLKKQNESLYNQLIQLQDVPSLPEKINELAKQFQVIGKMLQFFIPKYLEGSIEDYLRILQITSVNGFSSLPTERVYDEHGKIQSQVRDFGGIYIKASRMNHSCSPNSSWFVSPKSPFRIRIRTCADVKKGEFLTVTYSDPICTMGTPPRQKSIRAKFGFICKCPRCLDPTEFGTFMSAFPCDCEDKKKKKQKDEKDSDEEKPIFLLPQDPLNLDPNSLWKCTGCGAKQKAGEISLQSKMIDMKIEMAKENGTLESFVDNFFYFGGNKKNPLDMNFWVFQKAARLFLTEFIEKEEETSDKKGKKCFLLCKHLLDIEGKVSPGVSYLQAKTWKMMSRVLLRSIKNNDCFFMTPDAMYRIENCKKALENALEFYNGSTPAECGESVDVKELKEDLDFIQRNEKIQANFQSEIQDVLSKQKE